MIYKNSILYSVDNSGASRLQCIHVSRKGTNKLSGSVGTIVKASVKRLKRSIPKKKVKKSEVVNALIVSVRKPLTRKTGLGLCASHNNVVVLNKELNGILSNRIVMPIFIDIRKHGFSKLLTLAPKVL